MDVKQTLRQYWPALTYAQKCFRELDDARNATPKSPNMDGMPRSGRQTTLDLQMTVIESAQKRFEAAREIALEQLSELEEMIDTLPEFDQKLVLYYRHIYRLKWCDVAERMNWSESTVRRIHAKALKEMERNA